MNEKGRHISEGVSLISIAVAYALHTLTDYRYYGPIILICVGVLQIVLPLLAEREGRRIPFIGIVTVALGVSLLIVVISGGQEKIIAGLMSVIVAAAGVRMLLK